MKCKECNYENPDDALNCGLCCCKLNDELASAVPEPSLNVRGQENPSANKEKPLPLEDINGFLQDYKGLVAVGICVLLVCIFFSARSFASVQKHKDFENKIAELSYPIYAALVTGREPDSEKLGQVKSLIQDYAGRFTSLKDFQSIQAAIQRGQERARKKIKRDYNVKCPYF